MNTQLILFKGLKAECERTQRLVDQLTQRKSQLPAGSLTYNKGSYYRAFTSKGKRQQILIPEDSEGKMLIPELQERRYISKALPILKGNLACCRKAINQLKLYDPPEIKNKLSLQYRNFNLSKIAFDGDVDPDVWAKEPYGHNTSFQENLKYRSEGGQPTRSKAEADIATKLEQMGLVYRYEPILYLGTYKVLPDFCALHPVSRKQIYWEHYGLMDNPDYANDAMDKLRLYAEHGYQLGDNLIMTWETRQASLTFEHINDRIRIYFA